MCTQFALAGTELSNGSSTFSHAALAFKLASNYKPPSQQQHVITDIEFTCALLLQQFESYGLRLAVNAQRKLFKIKIRCFFEIQFVETTQ